MMSIRSTSPHGDIDERTTSPCTSCCDLNPQNLPGNENKSISPTIEMLRETRDSGCRFCTLICEALDYYLQKENAKLSPMFVGLDFHPRQPVQIFRSLRLLRFPLIYLYTPPGSIAAWKTLGSLKELPALIGSEESFLLQKQWLKECLTEHEECHHSIQSPLPKRVLNVGCENMLIRLEEPHGVIAPFAALSHCWGDKRSLTSTLSTLHLRMRKIEWNEIPPLFQDAIKVTRELGLTYLWIDSLCIIQDDQLDWEIESAKMGTIYETAQIVIAANNSLSSDTPFLGLRQPEYSHPLELKYERDDGQYVSVKSRPDIHYMYAEPLETRAWAFQEQWLSTRLLRFTANEVIWKCREMICCECESSKHITTEGFALRGDVLALESINPRPMLQSPAYEWFYSWHAILTLYTTRKLTRNSDKLPAISGIAAAVSKATNSAYVAGLWKDNILFELQWTTYDVTLPNQKIDFDKLLVPPSKPTSEYRAPTFSWASIDAEIQYQARDQYSYFQSSEDSIVVDSSVIDINCTLKGANPFGEVVDGFIVLEGPLSKAWLSSDDRRKVAKNLYCIHFGEIKGIVHADVPLAEGVGKTMTGKEALTIRRSVPGESQTSIAGLVWCLTLCHRGNSEALTLVLGLSGRVPGAYERLGRVFWEPITECGGRELGVREYKWRLPFDVGQKTIVKIV